MAEQQIQATTFYDEHNRQFKKIQIKNFMSIENCVVKRYEAFKLAYKFKEFALKYMKDNYLTEKRCFWIKIYYFFFVKIIFTRVYNTIIPRQ